MDFAFIHKQKGTEAKQRNNQIDEKDMSQLS